MREAFPASSQELPWGHPRETPQHFLPRKRQASLAEHGADQISVTSLPLKILSRRLLRENALFNAEGWEEGKDTSKNPEVEAGP